jgi:hypothetical protein
LRHRIGRGNRPRLERHDDRVGVGLEIALRHADGLHHPHPGAHQVVREVGGAGEVVGDAAQQQRPRHAQ